MSIKGSEIESTEKLNLLGVTIDSKLNFNHHISNVCKKASQRIGVLMRLKNLIPTEAKLQLYKAAILPHLTYCHLTWHFCKASDRRNLSVYKKEDSGRVLRINFLATRNYWQKQTYHRYTTDDYRTLLSLCIRLSINYCHRDFVIFFKTVARITYGNENLFNLDSFR